MTQSFLKVEELDKQSAGTGDSMKGAQSVAEKVDYVKGKGNLSKDEQEQRAKLRLEFREQYRTAVANGVSGSGSYDKVITDQLKNSQDAVIGVPAEKRIAWLAASATGMHYREQVELIKQKALSEMLSRQGGDRDTYTTVLQVSYKAKENEVQQILQKQEEIKSLIEKGGSDWIANYDKAHGIMASISDKLSKDPELKEALAAAQLMKELGIPAEGTVPIADDVLLAAIEKTKAEISKVRAWVGADENSTFTKKEFRIENYSVPMGGYIGYRLLAALADIQAEEGKPEGTGGSAGSGGSAATDTEVTIPADLDILVGKKAERLYSANLIGGRTDSNRTVSPGIEWEPLSLTKAPPVTGQHDTPVLINEPSDLMLAMVMLDKDGKPTKFETPRGWEYSSLYMFGKTRTSQFVNGTTVDKKGLAEAMKKELEAFMADSSKEYLPVYIVQNTQWFWGLQDHMGYLTKDAVRKALGNK
jgi:hypothetical protein